ncbi:MAG: DUF4397 domain-containing protein [Actinomycetia bacterium]|nr:DUF4397 domain-containing protein [Actinomycetes bacterium]
MKRLIATALTVAAVLTIALISGPAGAQTTTDVYVVHGLNLDGQTAQTDGGTNVTVCANGAELIGDFEFGQIVGPTALTSGTAVDIVVYGGANVDCADPGQANALITQSVTPTGGAVALVATSAANTLALTPYPLNSDCVDEGSGRLTAAHASGDTPEVTVLVAGDPVGNLTFGNSLDADLPAASYDVQVNLGDTAVVGPASIPVAAQANTLVFVVGNIAGDDGSTPVVPLVGEDQLEQCETTTTTTTAGDTTTTVAPAPSAVAPATATQSGAAPLAITG